MGGARGRAEGGEFGGFQREAVIRAAAVAVLGQVLFDDRGPQRHGCDGGGIVKRVVGKARHKAEARDHVGQGAQVVILGGRGVARDAVEDRKVAAAPVAGGGDRLGDLLGVGHAGRDDHRLAGGGGIADERQVHGLEARDLVGGGAQILEQVDGGGVEGRGEDRQAARAGMGEKGRVPVPWGIGGAVELVQALAGPLAGRDLEFRAGGVQGDRVGGIGLDLDRVGPGGGGGIDDAEGGIKAAVVVRRKLGDQIGRVRGADGAAIDADLGGGGGHRAPLAARHGGQGGAGVTGRGRRWKTRPSGRCRCIRRRRKAPERRRWRGAPRR